MAKPESNNQLTRAACWAAWLLTLAGCGESGPDDSGAIGGATSQGGTGSGAPSQGGMASSTAGASPRGGGSAAAGVGGGSPGGGGATPSGGTTGIGNGGFTATAGSSAGGGLDGSGGVPPIPPCAEDEVRCGSCVKVASDTNHCGVCGNQCPTGASCVNGACYGGGQTSCEFPLPKYDGNGSLTYYTLNMGSKAVNCSYPILGRNPDKIGYIHTGDGQYFGAMNTADYNDAAVCGGCVEVSRDDGRKVTITIVDQCPVGTNPKCKKGHIDLSRAAFDKLGNSSEGYLGTGNGGRAGRISWKYVACPGDGKLTYRLKEPDNAAWNEILVGNTLTPITKLDAFLNGSWQTGKRQDYNYWSISGGNIGGGPWLVRVTDIRGNVAEYTMQGGVEEQVASNQFPACQ